MILHKFFELIENFAEVTLKFIPWIENKEANELAQTTSRVKIPKDAQIKFIIVEKRLLPSIFKR